MDLVSFSQLHLGQQGLGSDSEGWFLRCVYGENKQRLEGCCLQKDAFLLELTVTKPGSLVLM